MFLILFKSRDCYKNNPDISHFAPVEVHLQDKHLGAELLDQRLGACTIVTDIA